MKFNPFMNLNRIYLLAVSFLICNTLIGQDNPIELGQVEWLRSYDAAVEESLQEGKPIFMLFQEVPGCSNCTKYGTDILSHPLIVEFIETAFVPLAIYNNKGGADKKVLKQFGEPAWNNPVVRLVDARGRDVAPRIGNFRSSYLLLTTMTRVMEDMQHSIPNYVRLLERELKAKEEGLSEAYLSMYCFWTGEKEIAQIDGIVATEAGYMHGKEVVKISWDKNLTNLETIATRASTVKCADQVYSNSKEKVVDRKTSNYQKDNEDKYYLIHSPYKYIPLTELQKTLVNSALGKKMNPSQYLSPRQLDFLETPESIKSLVSESIYNGWYP